MQSEMLALLNEAETFLQPLWRTSASWSEAVRPLTARGRMSQSIAIRRST